jgi:uncharacterized RDD family membrane protein YckC
MPYCAHCGHEISPLATACPSCGRPTTGIAEVAIAYGPPPLQLAGFWIRFLGYMIDAIIVGLAAGLLATFVIHLPGVLIVNGNSLVVNGQISSLSIDGGALLIREAFSLGCAFVYRWLLLGLNDGRTPGAMAVRVRVARPDGTRISFAQAGGRELMAIVSRIVLWLGFLWAVWDPEKCTWQDSAAVTRVFRT